MFTKKKSTAIKPPQNIQKAVSPKPAKVGKLPAKLMATKKKPATKKAKAPSKGVYRSK